MRRRLGASTLSSAPAPRNGYRHRDFGSRFGTIDVAIPKMRNGFYFPDWLVKCRRRAEGALTHNGRDLLLLGVSTRRMDKLVESLGLTRLSTPRVSVIVADLDAQVAEFRSLPLDDGTSTFVAADALALRVSEGGWVVNVHALLEGVCFRARPTCAGPGGIELADPHDKGDRGCGSAGYT